MYQRAQEQGGVLGSSELRRRRVRLLGQRQLSAADEEDVVDAEVVDEGK